jgi:hypothetical protein
VVGVPRAQILVARLPLQKLAAKRDGTWGWRVDLGTEKGAPGRRGGT